MDKKKIFQRTNFLLFLLCSLIILIEAALPGNSSSSQSNFVSNIISSVYNGVKNISSKNIYPTSLEVEEINEAFTNDTFSLSYKVLPENATFKNVVFESSSPSIASIDDKGIITCLKEGNVEISCKIEIPEKNIIYQKKFPLQIKDILPTSIYFVDVEEGNSLTIKENEYVHLNANILPLDTTFKDIEYFIKDNSSYVYENASLKLDSNILHIKNYSSSIYQVWAFCKADPSINTYINIKQVKDEKEQISLSSIKINLNEDIYVNQTYDLSVSFLPVNTTQTYLKYETSYPDAYINDEGKLCVKKKSFSSINIKVTSLSNEEISSSIDLKVKNNLGFNISIDSKQKDDIFLLENKCSYEINVSYFPSTTFKDITIISSNPSIIKVYDNFTISVLQKGQCNLEIRSCDEDETFSQIIQINVINKDFAKEIKSFTLIIRKTLGHFLLFTFTSIFLSLFLLNTINKKETYISFIVCESSGLYLAFLSEFIQYFTPGRACALSDVGIDFLGFNLGIIIIFTFFVVKLIIKYRTKNSKKNS